MSGSPPEGLHELARLYQIQTSYVDTTGRTRHSSSSAIRCLLKELGAEVDDSASVQAAIRLRRQVFASRRVEPVITMWDGLPSNVEFHLPSGWRQKEIHCRLILEGGEILSWSVEVESLERPSATRNQDHDDQSIRVLLELPYQLAHGYHNLQLNFGDATSKSLILRAPGQAFIPQTPESMRSWGVFAPLYALQTRRSWGAGDYSDLSSLIDWTAAHGGRLVSTLPLLATKFGDDAWVSPYSPSTRLFWSEFYLDPRELPEFKTCQPARQLVDSEEFQKEIEEFRSAPLIDYPRQMRWKRRVLECLAAEAFKNGVKGAQPDLKHYMADHPEAETYARFMASNERQSPLLNHPSSAREDNVECMETDDRTWHYHLYVQWRTDWQVRSVAMRAKQAGLAWYVDYTVGVDPHGYDVWSRPELFCRGASVGCPPDEGFTKGQNWGFPPIHPERQRETGYEYFIGSLRNHLRYADALRIDHVMGLHRLYWIPEGCNAKDGAYITYPAEEYYAILCIESHRHRAWLVGEDLGTVPAEVRPAMQARAFRRLYVLQHSLNGNDELPNPPSTQVVASINTHDMPMFASFWRGEDIARRVELGLLNPEVAANEESDRPAARRGLITRLQCEGLLSTDHTPSDVEILKATCIWLAASPAPMLVLNLEDFWGETEPQNIPGTTDESPNWRRKLGRLLEEFDASDDLSQLLRDISRIRHEGQHSNVNGAA